MPGLSKVSPVLAGIFSVTLAVDDFANTSFSQARQGRYRPTAPSSTSKSTSLSSAELERLLTLPPGSTFSDPFSLFKRIFDGILLLSDEAPERFLALAVLRQHTKVFEPIVFHRITHAGELSPTEAVSLFAVYGIMAGPEALDSFVRKGQLSSPRNTAYAAYVLLQEQPDNRLALDILLEAIKSSTEAHAQKEGVSNLSNRKLDEETERMFQETLLLSDDYGKEAWRFIVTSQAWGDTESAAFLMMKLRRIPPIEAIFPLLVDLDGSVNDRAGFLLALSAVLNKQEREVIRRITTELPSALSAVLSGFSRIGPKSTLTLTQDDADTIAQAGHQLSQEVQVEIVRSFLINLSSVSERAKFLERMSKGLDPEAQKEKLNGIVEDIVSNLLAANHLSEEQKRASVDALVKAISWNSSWSDRDIDEWFSTTKELLRAARLVKPYDFDNYQKMLNRALERTRATLLEAPPEHFNPKFDLFDPTELSEILADHDIQAAYINLLGKWQNVTPHPFLFLSKENFHEVLSRTETEAPERGRIPQREVIIGGHAYVTDVLFPMYGRDLANPIRFQEALPSFLLREKDFYQSLLRIKQSLSPEIQEMLEDMEAENRSIGRAASSASQVFEDIDVVKQDDLDDLLTRYVTSDPNLLSRRSIEKIGKYLRKEVQNLRPADDENLPFFDYPYCVEKQILLEQVLNIKNYYPDSLRVSAHVEYEDLAAQQILPPSVVQEAVTLISSHIVSTILKSEDNSRRAELLTIATKKLQNLKLRVVSEKEDDPAKEFHVPQELLTTDKLTEIEASSFLMRPLTTISEVIAATLLEDKLSQHPTWRQILKDIMVSSSVEHFVKKGGFPDMEDSRWDGEYLSPLEVQALKETTAKATAMLLTDETNNNLFQNERLSSIMKVRGLFFPSSNEKLAIAPRPRENFREEDSPSAILKYERTRLKGKLAN
jgi:hypothetical protein